MVTSRKASLTVRKHGKVKENLVNLAYPELTAARKNIERSTGAKENVARITIYWCIWKNG